MGGRTVGGEITLHKLPLPLSVRVLTDGREGPEVSCRALVGEYEDEILLSDYAIDALGVKIERQGEGVWRFVDEDHVRPSVPRQQW